MGSYSSLWMLVTGEKSDPRQLRVLQYEQALPRPCLFSPGNAVRHLCLTTVAVQLCTGWLMLVSKSTKVAVRVQSENLHPGIQAVIHQCQKQYPHECLLKDTEFPSGYSLMKQKKVGF